MEVWPRTGFAVWMGIYIAGGLDMYMYTHSLKHMCVHVCRYMYTHMHVHMFTHTYAVAQLQDFSAARRSLAMQQCMTVVTDGGSILQGSEALNFDYYMRKTYLKTASLLAHRCALHVSSRGIDMHAPT